MKTKCMSCKGSMKKMAVGGTTTKRIIKKSTGGMYGIPQENLGTSGQYGFAQKGGATGTHKMPNGKVMLNSKMKKGGTKKYEEGGPTTKPISTPTEQNSQPNTPPTGPNKLTGNPRLKKGGTTDSFKKLAPPYNKATYADKIAGAKKSAGSKKLPKAQLGGILKLAIRATKSLAKTLKPIAKKIVSKSKTTATKKFNYPKDKVKSMFPRVAEDVKKYNSVTNPQKLFERKTIKDQMKEWEKAAKLKYPPDGNAVYKTFKNKK